MSFIKIYTGGTFDIPHLGHYNFFKQVKELFPDSWLIVALNTDEFIKEFKGSLPLFSYEERERFLKMIPFVDTVIVNTHGADSKPTISMVEPNVIAIGNDWLEKNYCKQMGFDAKWLREKNISLVYLPYTDGISTTEIKKRINQRDLDEGFIRVRTTGMYTVDPDYFKFPIPHS